MKFVLLFPYIMLNNTACLILTFSLSRLKKPETLHSFWYKCQYKRVAKLDIPILFIGYSLVFILNFILITLSIIDCVILSNFNF